VAPCCNSHWLTRADFSEIRAFFEKIGSNLYLYQPKTEEIEAENRMHPPSERAKKKTLLRQDFGGQADPATRRGGFATRADLPNPPATSKIRKDEPFCNPLDPSQNNRASCVCRSAPEQACQVHQAKGMIKGIAADPDLSAVEKGSPHRVSNRGNLPPRLRIEYAGPWKMWTKIPRSEKWSRFLDTARTYFQQ